MAIKIKKGIIVIMPDFLVHQVVATRTLEKLPRNISEQIKVQLPAFIFGAQGPDFFYYRGLLNPLKSFEPIHQLSDYEHTHKTQALLAFGFNYVNAHQQDAQFAILFAYWCGFLCHYSLDATAHPLIGQLGPTSKEHKRIELELDASMAHQTLHSPIYTLKLFNAINMGHHIPKAIADFHIALLGQVYGITCSYNDINASYHNMRTILNIYHCGNNLKLCLMRHILKRYPIDISPYFYDYATQPHLISDKHCSEFNELFNVGTEQSIKLISQFESFISHNQSSTVKCSSLPSRNFLGESLSRVNNG